MERHRHTEDILDELKPEIKGKIENDASIQGRVPYTSIGNNYTLSINGRITDSLIAPHSKIISNKNTPHKKIRHRQKNLHPTINTKN